jgi:hypothetical protein
MAKMAKKLPRMAEKLPKMAKNATMGVCECIFTKKWPKKY